MRITGIGKRSAIQIDMTAFVDLAMRNGKVLRMEPFATRDEALEAEGLSE